VKIGIAGAGRLGSVRAGVLAEHREVDRLIVADVDRERAGVLAEKVGGVVADTPAELFSAGLDGVVIATASAAHAEWIELALAAGVPVFCEKPVAVDVAETRAILDGANARGVPIQVGFQRRFDPGYVAARRAMRDGQLGDLRRVHLVSADPAPSAAEFVATSGGIYRDLLIHDFDILRWVTGREVVDVYAAGANRGAAYIAEADDVDETVLVLRLDDGTVATAHGSRYNGAGYDIRMEVAGTSATHVVGLSERSPLKSAEPEVSFPDGEPWTLFWERFGPSYGAEIHAFVDLLAGRRENPCTVDDALQALYVAEAAELSRREGRPVEVVEVAATAGDPTGSR